MQVKWRNLRVAPRARLIRSELLERPTAHGRAELAVAGMVCSR